jgi:hypothetical protein
METLTSVTELLLLAGLGWAVAQSLADQAEPQAELIPIPVKEKDKSPSARP